MLDFLASAGASWAARLVSYTEPKPWSACDAASPQQPAVPPLSQGVFAMLHKVSPMVLSALLILGSTGLPSMAQAAQQGSTAPGADLFQQGWKSDQGLGTPINIPEAFRLYQQAAALGNPLA